MSDIARFSLYDYFKRVMIYFNETSYWWQLEAAGRPEGRVIVGAMREQTISPTATTEWASLSELIPQLGILRDLSQKIGQITGSGFGGAVRYLDVKGWKSTSQMKVSFKLHFDTITDARKDVWLPCLALWGYTLPEQKFPGGMMSVPGVDLFSAVDAALKGVGSGQDATITKTGSEMIVETAAASQNSKLVTIQLCGYLYMKDALLEKAVPTFSTNTTESGYPLWGEVDCEVSTLATADLTMISTMKQFLAADQDMKLAMLATGYQLQDIAFGKI